MIGGTVCALMAALNAWAYLTYHEPFNLAVAVFCAISAVLCAVFAS